MKTKKEELNLKVLLKIGEEYLSDALKEVSKELSAEKVDIINLGKLLRDAVEEVWVKTESPEEFATKQIKEDINENIGALTEIYQFKEFSGITIDGQSIHLSLKG